jgi:tRNA(adenine34) deaminase
MHGDSPMRAALDEARQAAARGEVPVGAVVMHGGAIIARAGNRVEELRDVTAHAELLALREAGRALHNARLTGCDLYVTLEPCPMCAAAISFARIRRLYFGAYDAKGGGVESGPRLYTRPTCHHAPEVVGGMRESECGLLLKDFFRARRQAGNYTLSQGGGGFSANSLANTGLSTASSAPTAAKYAPRITGSPNFPSSEDAASTPGASPATDPK